MFQVILVDPNVARCRPNKRTLSTIRMFKCGSSPTGGEKISRDFPPTGAREVLL
jgi:hypothetical protein